MDRTLHYLKQGDIVTDELICRHLLKSKRPVCRHDEYVKFEYCPGCLKQYTGPNQDRPARKYFKPSMNGQITFNGQVITIGEGSPMRKVIWEKELLNKLRDAFPKITLQPVVEGKDFYLCDCNTVFFPEVSTS